MKPASKVEIDPDGRRGDGTVPRWLEDELEQELRAEPPQAARDAAKRAYDSRLPDSALLPLISDSLLTEAGTAEEHFLQFENAGLSLDVRVEGAGGARQLRVESSARLSRVRLESPGWESQRRPGPALTFTEVPAATVRIHAVDEEGRALHTDWFRL